MFEALKMYSEDSKFIPSFRYFVESPFCESPGRVRT
jgi:hypothetical protein